MIEQKHDNIIQCLTATKMNTPPKKIVDKMQAEPDRRNPQVPQIPRTYLFLPEIFMYMAPKRGKAL